MNSQKEPFVTLLISIPHKRLDEINEMISSSKYSDINQFINVAIQSQLTLERTGPPFTLKSMSKNDSNLGIGSLYDSQGINFPDRVQLHHRESKDFPSIKPIKPEKSEWIWGQINRVLPIKLALRVLINGLVEKGDSLLIDEFHELLADVSTKTKQVLQQIDENENHSGSERFTTGFPKYNNTNSKTRFVEQFGAANSKKSRPSGGLIHLGFANIDDDVLIPTEMGLDFYRIPNNLFDVGDTDQAFTREETKFYCKYTLKFHEGERNAFNLIYKYVQKGYNSPKKLREKLDIHLPTQWSMNQKVTQVNGAVSRMADLNLLERLKNGRRVKYSITKFGEQILRSKFDK